MQAQVITSRFLMFCFCGRPGGIFPCEESPRGAPEHLIPLEEPDADDSPKARARSAGRERGEEPRGH